MYALGIMFEVNIPDDIKDKISGYRIVRLERKEVDKTILGSGILNYGAIINIQSTILIIFYLPPHVYLLYSLRTFLLSERYSPLPYYHHIEISVYHTCTSSLLTFVPLY